MPQERVGLGDVHARRDGPAGLAEHGLSLHRVRVLDEPPGGVLHLRRRRHAVGVTVQDRHRLARRTDRHRCDIPLEALDGAQARARLAGCSGTCRGRRRGIVTRSRGPPPRPAVGRRRGPSAGRGRSRRRPAPPGVSSVNVVGVTSSSTSSPPADQTNGAIRIVFAAVPRPYRPSAGQRAAPRAGSPPRSSRHSAARRRPPRTCRRCSRPRGRRRSAEGR